MRRRSRQQEAAAPATDPSTLPRPVLFADPRPGEQPQAFRGLAEESSPKRPSTKPAFAAVALMIVGVGLIGVSLITTRWPLLIVGVALGAVGAVLARRAHIMQDVSVTDSPEDHG